MIMPKISVIIANYNGKTLLEKCLESLFKVNYDNFEVILVDNNSTDETNATIYCPNSPLSLERDLTYRPGLAAFQGHALVTSDFRFPKPIHPDALA